MVKQQAITEAHTGLQTFLRAYEREHPDEVLHIERPIDANWEITALAIKLEQAKRFPVLVCHNVIVDGQPAEMPLVTFLTASRLRIARALGTDVRGAGLACYERLQRRQQPVLVSRAEAPVKEVVERGADVDVRRLPAPLHHSMDPGRYVTEGLFLTYNRGTRR